jgi:hypothetical protein
MSVPSRPLVATVATFLVLLAGCAEKTEGSPSAGDQQNPTGTTEQSTEETPSSEPSTAPGLADLKPCELLDANELAALQLTGGEEEEVLGSRRCQWRREGATINDSYTVSVGLLNDEGVGDLNAPQKQPTTVGSHEAVSFVDSAGNCGIGIAIGDDSRVETSATGNDQNQACQLAAQLATAIEPKLP